MNERNAWYKINERIGGKKSEEYSGTKMNERRGTL